MHVTLRNSTDFSTIYQFATCLKVQSSYKVKPRNFWIHVRLNYVKVEEKVNLGTYLRKKVDCVSHLMKFQLIAILFLLVEDYSS